MKKILNQFISLLFLLLIFFACSKDEDFDNKDFPIIYTEPVTDITSEGARFYVRIIEHGKLDIIDFGFFWGTNMELLESNASKISLGSDINGSSFSKELIAELRPSEDYYVRAYMQTEDYIIYGKAQIFKNVVDFWNIKGEIPIIADYISDNYYISAVGCEIDGIGYVSFSYNENDYYHSNSAGNFIYYDSQTEDWREIKTNLPFFYSNYYCYVSNNQIIFLGDWENYYYNPANKELNILDERGFGEGYYFKYQNEIFRVNIYSGSVSCYNITEDFWKGVSDIPSTALRNGTVVGEKAYVLVANNSFWQYNPNTYIWEKNISIPVNTEINYSIPVFSFQDKLYLAADDHIYRYSPLESKWEVSKYITPQFLNSNFLFQLNNQVFLNSNETIYAYEPLKDIFTDVTP